MTRSMYSTWKIALLSAWAGPSWISWASRERSASWAVADARLDVVDSEVSRLSVLGACWLHRTLSIRVVVHGQTISNARASPSGSSTGRVAPGLRGRARGSTLRRRRRHRGRPASACSSASRRTTSFAVERGSLARSSTSRGGSSGSARAGIRCVSAIQIGKFVMTGPATHRAGGRPRPSRPPAPCSGSRWPAEPAPNDGRMATENSSEPKTPRSAPSQATGRVQPWRRPTQAIERIEGEQGGHDQQDLDRAGRVEERAPRRGDREDEAGDEERGER